jgi:putative ABC transport system permease protein
MLGTFWRVVKQATRAIIRTPGFALAALLTLALGIGMNVAIFSVVKAVLISPNPLGYRDIDRIGIIYHQNLRADQGRSFNSYSEFRAFKESTTSFDSMAAFLQNVPLVLSGRDEPQHVRANLVTNAFFDVLGVQARIGRLFLPDDEKHNTSGIVVLSYGMWQRNFGEDTAVIGRPITLGATSYTVIGVLPPDFHYFTAALDSGFEADVYLPLTAASQIMDPEFFAHDTIHNLGAIARLKPGISFAQARSNLSSVFTALPKQSFDANWNLHIDPLRDVVSNSLREPLILMLAGTVMVFLISMANVSNLYLLRMSSRMTESSIRLALGATRFQLFIQFAAEGLLLTFCGAVGGLLLAHWSKDALVKLSPVPLLGMVEIRLDQSVLLFAFLLCIAGGLALAFIGIVASSRVSLADSLAQGGRSPAHSLGKSRLRGLLVFGELVLSTLLLTSTLMVTQSYRQLHDTSPGFRTDHLLSMRIELNGPRYAQEGAIANFRQEVLAKASTLPGITAAVLWAPLVPGDSYETISASPQFQPDESHPIRIVSRFHLISSGALRALEIPLIAGHEPTRDEATVASPVAVVSESLVKQLGMTSPIGSHFRAFQNSRLITVVGVAKDVHHRSRTGPYANSLNDMYLPLDQFPQFQDLNLLVRTTVPPESLIGTLRETVHSIDPASPVFDTRTMEDVMQEQERDTRLTGIWMDLFAILALFLTIIGIYGVASFAVRQRTSELGIRIALGARRLDIIKLVMLPNLLVAESAIIIGTCASIAMAQSLRSILFGVSPTDALTYILVAILLNAVVCLSCFLPAWRATRVDPMVALRHQ